jgi:glutamate dehydrogenase
MPDDQIELRDLKHAGSAVAAPPPPPAGGNQATLRLVAILARRISASLLPGDSLLSETELAAAASFLLASAQARTATKSALAIDTVSGAASSRFMRIAVINEDMPFLVDSIAATIAAHELEIHRLFHPVIAVRRDDAGQITDFPEVEAPGDWRESLVYIETRRANARQRAKLTAALEATLADVRASVADWPAMQVAIGADAERVVAAGRPEGAALLRWFQSGMLTQLGAVQRRRDGSETAALGICRNPGHELLSPASYAQAFAWFDARSEAATGTGIDADTGVARLPLIVKSNLIAHVHRREPLDLFIVPLIADGAVAALSVHAGVWTSAALAAAPDRVPRLRAQLGELMEKYGFQPSGHAAKALVHALTKLPHDLLIGFTDPDLERVALAMMSLVDRPRPALALVKDLLSRHVFAFVWLPRDALTTQLRLDVGAMLTEASGAKVLDWSLEVEGSSLAQLLFVLDIREGRKAAGPGPDKASVDDAKLDEAGLDEARLGSTLQIMLRGWGDAVESELARAGEGSRAAAIAARYAEAFPPAYRSFYGPAEAAADIARLQRLGGDSASGAPRGVRLYRLTGDAERQLRLKLYQRSGALILSEAVPALENFGFRVIDNFPFNLAKDDAPLASLHDFLLELPVGIDPAAVMANVTTIEEAMAAVANGQAENDPFNQLITGVGLTAREANWLRAFYRYLRQAGLSFSIGTAVDALIHAPKVTCGLIDLFRAHHQPGQPDGASAAADAAIRDGLSGVAAINDDRLLRGFRALIAAILRTNAFVVSGKEALAFKLDSAQVPGLPRPLPWREIFVYSDRVEGIHLRAGPVARGGIRWSDRRDDFRTEVLGLMKAQRVKNAVIVPTGAKGGFYPKQLPDPACAETGGREAWAAEGRASYQLFIRALLSLTDNIVDGKVVHPDDIRIHDGEDPYFVVAADKGTASFSDTANAIAQAQDFWLDDAFASGGSKGYDHKAMGITARGAWLSVQRHFRELGIDIQTQAVRVVGVGDMSGDVFGNGMLLSKTLKLVAAFDHRHIFLDPNPDPTLGWAERSRLFALPRSSWDDYDPARISAGGGVFPRSLKAIPLSPEIRAALAITAESVDPEALISAILTAPIDLLWFGGIGTYVKAIGEANSAVGDHANDAVRVDGRAVRARVIGEGANLGCTQAGRIEYARHGGLGAGGRGNTDFIDNSAGVDCSDHEVNIKIALAAARRTGRLNEAARVDLLAAMTDDVAALVLEDNRLQALALSVAEAGGISAIASQTRLIERLEEDGQLDRNTEGLADKETLARRGSDMATGDRGLTRPELAVLLSSAKLALQAELESSDVPDDPGLAGELIAAFPPPMQAAYRNEIAGHRLRREIIATRLSNRLINRIGFIHPFELAAEEGATLAEVTAAFIAAERLFGMPAIWQAIESAEMPEAARIGLFADAAQAVRTQMADLLRAGAGRVPPTRLAAELTASIDKLTGARDSLLAGETRAHSARMRDTFIAAGVPTQVAETVTRLFDLDGAVGLARLANDGAMDVVELTRAFTEIGAQLGLDWAQLTAARMSPRDPLSKDASAKDSWAKDPWAKGAWANDPWERLLVAGLARDFQQMRLDFLRRIAPAAGRRDPLADVQGWLAAHDAGVRHFRTMVSRAQHSSGATAAMLAQIASQARNLLAR